MTTALCARVQTMDVVYPASPMLLYSNPALLRLLLIPVLNFANNGTGTPFSNPFSPHQVPHKLAPVL